MAPTGSEADTVNGPAVDATAGEIDDGTRDLACDWQAVEVGRPPARPLFRRRVWSCFVARTRLHVMGTWKAIRRAPDRKRPSRPYYPSRRERFMEDAAMSREMYRL